MKAHKSSGFGWRLVRSGMTLLLALLVGGCGTVREYSLTYRLWDKGLRPSSRPAVEPELAAFTSQTNADVLMTYDEIDERADKVLRRAYFVRANEARIAVRKKPAYVDSSIATNMSAVPLVSATNQVNKVGVVALYPVNTDNGPGFELYRDGQPEGSHGLPIYDVGIVTPARVALTPVAVVGDAVMVGLAAGALAAIAWVMSGCPPFGN